MREHLTRGSLHVRRACVCVCGHWGSNPEPVFVGSVTFKFNLLQPVENFTDRPAYDSPVDRRQQRAAFGRV